jgi:adenylate cyclase
VAERDQGEEEPGRARRAGNRAATLAGRLDRHPKLLTVTKLARELLPGDSAYGDPLSTAGGGQAGTVGRRISELTAERPGVLREAGMSALQVLQAVSESRGRGRGDRELAVVFTDLIEFSKWALEAGDESALELLRDVGRAVEPQVEDAGGEVVKWLGDGMMAVFDAPQRGLDAVLRAREQVERIDADGYDVRMRAGMHLGRPRKLGGDYLGVDVNVAARVTEEGSADEVLVTGEALERLDTESLDVRRKRLFRAKGMPRDVTVYSVTASS